MRFILQREISTPGGFFSWCYKITPLSHPEKNQFVTCASILFLRSQSQMIFMPLVPRGHDCHICHIVIVIKLTQVNREGSVFVRFIKRYLAGNDVWWVILQCNITASLPWLIQLFTLRIPWCLLFQIPTSILFKTLFSILSLLLRYLWIHSAIHIRPTKSYVM